MNLKIMLNTYLKANYLKYKKLKDYKIVYSLKLLLINSVNIDY